MAQEQNKPKYTYTMTMKLTGNPWNWNNKQMANIMVATKSQAIIQELDKVDARVSNMDLTNIKEIIMKIANKKLDS